MSAGADPSAVAVSGPRVGLFVTCLVDLFRPNVGFAAVKLLENAGCRVEVPALQTCCGQPAYNSGDADDAREIAEQVISNFSGFDYIVAPSGSCTGMLKTHYPELFVDDPPWHERVQDFVSRCHELMSFLTDILNVAPAPAAFEGTVTYHDSCSGLRELGIKAQPRRLLADVSGLTLAEMHDAEVCCGFGGTFCVKYPELSGRMVSDKVRNVTASGAEALLGGDLGCLLNIAGRLKREGRPVKTYHAVEVLAGMANTPAIGEGEQE